MRNKTPKGSSDYDTLDLATACLEVDEPHFPIFFFMFFLLLFINPSFAILLQKGSVPVCGRFSITS